MFDDLSQVKRRYEELAYRMTTPEAMNDPAAYAAMMREYKELTPLVEAYRSYTALQKEVDEEKALLDAPTEDAAFNDMVQQELRENWQKLEDLEQKIRLLLLPKDANDEKSIIMEIRAGAGGEEAALFCPQPAPYVHHVRRTPELGLLRHQPERDRAGRCKGDHVLDRRARRLQPLKV